MVEGWVFEFMDYETEDITLQKREEKQEIL